jgi:hypothetical protein
MMEDLTERDLVQIEETCELSMDDDDFEDEPLSTYMSGRHRDLMDGEAVPTIPTMYQQLAMTWRGAQWAEREFPQEHQAR